MTQETQLARFLHTCTLGDICPICHSKVEYRESDMPLSFPESMRKYPNIFYGCKCYEGSSKDAEKARLNYIEGMKSVPNIGQPVVRRSAYAVFDIRTNKTFAIFADQEHAIKYGKSLVGEFSAIKNVEDEHFS